MTEAVSGGDGKLDRIIQARIDKRPLAVQLQIGHKGVPVNDRPPGAGPGMQVHARQPERGRNEGRCRLTVWAKSLAVQDQLAIEFARPPTGEDGAHGRLIDPQQRGERAEVGGQGDDGAYVEIAVGPPIQPMADRAGRNPWSTERVVDPRVAQRALKTDGLELALATEEAGHAQHRGVGPRARCAGAGGSARQAR